MGYGKILGTFHAIVDGSISIKAFCKHESGTFMPFQFSNVIMKNNNHTKVIHEKNIIIISINLSAPKDRATFSFLSSSIFLKNAPDINMSRDARKPVFGVSDQVRHKPVCAVSENG